MINETKNNKVFGKRYSNETLESFWRIYCVHDCDACKVHQICHSIKKVELKRVYRCPNCDVIVLKKLYYNSVHDCSCGIRTHIKNLKLNFERK